MLNSISGVCCKSDNINKGILKAPVLCYNALTLKRILKL